ncbi:HPr family phosphocarrier protein [Domibacillus sp. DTU_2020_1001157_1_SI_ALB_TIR_016]|uniref:HPr family phosphocarrier protein n=1 Tax=Domibacillus sp. DTU_2020_1001157_1_SI_ALB_TIR_016 TaxID=3077789 RepID=UPI0028EA94B6|nr:HPr family phosphocarrier protein [Domibacillus sp. DTU_2020_1001157_1_SI_ALB_TIR_016]WNS78631.1 HPr family phosphocarrier protein [Domibacillus sp. DTU_2020_1001157_1_SI_ALB_TIR_016]
MTMLQKQIVVGLDPGLESRAASHFVQKASSFSSDILLIKNEKKVAAKSIMGIMASAIRQGDNVTLITNGQDEEKAIHVLGGILTSGFDK